MKLRVSQAAAEDLEDIWLYTVEHWSVQQADRYIGLLTGGFDLILSDPKAGRDLADVRDGYCGLAVGSHLIFYRLHEADHTVEVIRVLHERMDIEGQLKL